MSPWSASFSDKAHILPQHARFVRDVLSGSKCVYINKPTVSLVGVLGAEGYVFEDVRLRRGTETSFGFRSGWVRWKRQLVGVLGVCLISGLVVEWSPEKDTLRRSHREGTDTGAAGLAKGSGNV